jgi:hypothetical protein
MSYNGTVRCRNCYGKGHNSRSCPDMTESYKRRAQAEVDQGDGREGHWHKEYAKRTGTWLNGDVATEMKKKRAGAVRRCKYCNKTGHNTRTCPELKTAKVEFMTQCLNVRKVVSDRLKELGMGVGALIKTEPRSHHADGDCLYMVTGIAWDEVTHETIRSNGTHPVRLKKLTTDIGSSWNNTTSLGLPNLQSHCDIEQNRWSDYSIVAPVPVAALSAPLLLCQDILVEEIFKDRQSPNHWENRNEA